MGKHFFTGNLLGTSVLGSEIRKLVFRPSGWAQKPATEGRYDEATTRRTDERRYVDVVNPRGKFLMNILSVRVTHPSA